MSDLRSDASIKNAFELAKEHYASIGVDVGKMLSKLKAVAVSIHCWQGDDVQGFEHDAEDLGGGIAVTGNYPGKARNADELRRDLEAAFALLPGRHRLNLHAIYGEFLTPTDRNEIGPEHFQGWIDWAREQEIGMDFNPSFFSHENAADGFTLSHLDDGIRNFWIEHGIASRQIGAEIGKALGSPCVTNFWVPDGYKDTPADRLAPRERLASSLDEIFSASVSKQHNLDAVECKLFGIGSESYVVGSHEFYLGYAISREKLLCLDAGHFHPTEIISDKISSVLMYLPEILLHVSRGVRWDSDHVVTYTDELQAIAHEIVRQDYLDRVHIGLDFFDGSINRVAAWVIGTRNMLKALLKAMLEPVDQLKEFENSGDYTSRLAMMEELKSMPFGAVWDYYCLSSGVPVGLDWLKSVQQYDRDVQSNRSSVSERV
jgi:L-rhamnose isomerase